jgi:hypothetical protein
MAKKSTASFQHLLIAAEEGIPFVHHMGKAAVDKVVAGKVAVDKVVVGIHSHRDLDMLVVVVHMDERAGVGTAAARLDCYIIPFSLACATLAPEKAYPTQNIQE